ncbi:MAG: CsbD family protein [Bradyrhizobium sp.]|nr:CsbD family protein [Bradyrhizobium sp.]
MSKVKAVKDHVTGKAKRLTGEVLGDQKLHDEGKAQEQEGREESEQAGKIKPLGNLDQLT